jgi:hypothetical protein
MEWSKMNEVDRVVTRNRTPTWVIVFFYVAAAFSVACGGCLIWQLAKTDIAFGWATGIGFLIAGAGLAGDAGHRLAVNRVIDEMLAAIDRADGGDR